MKKFRKLIPALCMLLISAMLMGTSTYAWFSMNDTVTATGMQVTASTNANLYIKEGIITEATSITGTVAQMGTTQHVLKPADLTDSTGTVTVQIPNEYKPDQKPTVGSAGSAQTWTNKGTFTKTTTTQQLNTTSDDKIGNYIAGETMTLVRKAASNAKKSDIGATVTITISGESALNGALRCGFLVNTTWTESEDASSHISGSKITWTFNNLISELTDNTVQTVTFVVWFEGEDSDCTSNNAIALSNLSVEISFKSSDHPSGT